MENNSVFILLAGGKSERMGVAKGLLKYKQTFWILEQLNRISKSSISEVIIGLGYNFQQYFDAIPWFEEALTKGVEFKELKVKVIINKNPELGSFSTLQSCLKEMDSTDSVIVSHIDIPILNSTELNKIISEENDIVSPNFNGKNGHPIKMNTSFWVNLLIIDPSDKDARLDIQIKKVNPAKTSIIEVSDRAILYNLNNKKDWISFLNASN